MLNPCLVLPIFEVLYCVRVADASVEMENILSASNTVSVKYYSHGTSYMVMVVITDTLFKDIKESHVVQMIKINLLSKLKVSLMLFCSWKFHCTTNLDFIFILRGF
uniref:Uncharacterized protein n=1 Tax=Anguilla anguilla TaxID=7936 RepID=A0A0E9S302_ANGAN